MKKFNTSLIAAMVTGGLLSVSAQAAVNFEKVFGAVWQPVASVAPSQAQVIYYRDKSAVGKEGAHVYVDGEYQSSLLPGMFSTFCVPAGSHSLGAFINDAPLYKSKEAQPYRDTFQGGKTYYVKYDADANGRPLLVNPQQAERELKGLKAQAHTLNRAASVEQCRYTGAPHIDYTLSSDVLFAFGKSGRNDITGQGRHAINELISKLRQDGVEQNRIQIIGHTDPIGTAATNMQLGQQRANTVRYLMMSGGLPGRNISVSSAGSSEPLVASCSGSRAEKIECYAPNRRVVVRVQNQ